MASWQDLLMQLFLYGPHAVSLVGAEKPSHLAHSQFRKIKKTTGVKYY